MQPLVGIPPRWRAGPRGRPRVELEPAYAAAVAEAGAVPLALPVEEDPAALVARLDALLVPGGPDFAPPRPYPTEVAFDLACVEQLAFDRALLDAARGRGLPVLGICYGMQLLALHAGGALHHHLPLDVPGASAHKPAAGDARHPLALEPGSRLAAILGVPECEVNSRHHQAVSDAGALRVAARAPDGVIEAVEASGGPLWLGVQWHPERMHERHRRPLFAALVAACRAG